MQAANVSYNKLSGVVFIQFSCFGLQATTYIWSNAPASFQVWTSSHSVYKTSYFDKEHVRYYYNGTIHDTSCVMLPHYKCHSKEANELNPSVLSFGLHLLNKTTCQCTLLLVYNLAQPEWVSIDCARVKLSHVVCEMQETKEAKVLTRPNTSFCERYQISWEGTCYLFITPSVLCVRKEYCRLLSGNEGDIKILVDQLLKALGKLDGNWGLSSVGPHPFMKGYSLCVSDTMQGKNFTQLYFHEINKTLISNAIFLQKKYSNHPYLFYKSRQGFCNSFTTKQVAGQANKTDDEHSQCFDKNPKDTFATLQKVCKQAHHVKLSLQHGQSCCEDKNMLPCTEDRSQCFQFSDICVFMVDIDGFPIPCKSGSLLQNCFAFQCNAHFKCPEYYCILWGYICNGKWDCPGGYDESRVFGCENHRDCSFMFKCHKSQLCFHMLDVCDSVTDCPLGDDEFTCDIQGSHCLEGCSCLHYAIECNNVLCNFTVGALPFVSFHIIHCRSNLSTNIMLNTNAIRVNFSHNLLSEIPHQICNSGSLFSLDLSFNNISKINFCLEQMYHLHLLFLQYNVIQELKMKTFSDQKFLRVLHLESNNLFSIHRNLFHLSAHLIAVFVANNSLTGENIAIFAGEVLSVQVIVSDNIALCCVASHFQKCIQGLPWHTKCFRLLGYKGLKIFMICGIIVSFVLNTLLGRLMYRSVVQAKKVKPYHIIVGSLPSSHVLVIVSFCIQLMSDSKFGNDFILHVNTWKASFTCKLLFCLILVHCLSMESLHLFLSLSRMMVILKPLNSSFKEAKYASKWLTCVFCICMLMGVSFMLKFLHSKIPNRLCLPFVDVTKSEWLMIFIPFFTLLVQILCIVFVSICDIMMLKKLAESSKATGRSNAEIDRGMLIQLLSLLFLNILCWIPSSLVHIVCVFLPKYPVVLTFWAAFLRMVFAAISDPIFFSVVHFKLSG